MAKSPFKMAGFSGFGNSPLRHPHDTWKQAASHDKDQPHPKSKITPETVVDDSGVEVDAAKTEDKPKKKKPVEGEPVKTTPVEEEEVPTRPTSWLKGEEGLIPDWMQPGVNRPEVPIRKKSKKK